MKMKKFLQESNWKIQNWNRKGNKTFPFFSIFLSLFHLSLFSTFFQFLLRLKIEKKAETKGLSWFTDCAFFCAPFISFFLSFDNFLFICALKKFFFGIKQAIDRNKNHTVFSSTYLIGCDLICIVEKKEEILIHSFVNHLPRLSIFCLSKQFCFVCRPRGKSSHEWN